MKKLANLFKDTLLGGALVVLPAWLAVLLLAKALSKLQVLVKPISDHLPPTIGHPAFVAALVMVVLCFMVGALVQTALGRKVEKTIEESILKKVPGYAAIRSVAEQLGDLEHNHGFKPALIKITDGLVPGFIVETHANGLCTVFLPSSPATAAGTILIVATAQVQPVNVSVPVMFRCITKWGTGSSKLLAAIEPSERC